MRLKKGKPGRSVRYLLSADSRLRRLSLRKMSERVKKTKRHTRSNRIKQSGGPLSSLRLGGGTQVAVLGIVFLLAAAAMITARQPLSEADIESLVPEAGIEAPPAQPKIVVGTKKPAVAKRAVTDVPAKRSSSNGSGDTVPASAPATSNEHFVTITGCLQRDAETFWLKDTSGAELPKSRGWRSGFLTRRSPRITVVDVTNSLKLPDYVGQRVTATGVIEKREMRARSLQRVAASCN